MSDIVTNFWNRYIGADELERYRMLDEELIKYKDKRGFYKGFNTTIFQSYLDDLIEILKEK